MASGPSAFFDSLIAEPFWRSPPPAHADPGRTLAAVNSALIRLDDEIRQTYKTLCDLYLPRFPELATLGLSAEHFALIVLAVGSSADLGRIPFDTVLGPVEAMAVKLTAASSKGRCLDEEAAERAVRLAGLIMRMLQVRAELVDFVDAKVTLLAPNTAALVGTKVASQLISATGGILQLARCPANNIQVIGYDAERARDLAGYSLARLLPHVGFLGDAPMVRRLPAEQSGYRRNAVRLLAAKTAMAARADAAGSSMDGGFGRRLLEEVEGRLERLTEPLPFHLDKPLPPPITQARKRRGGSRARRLKQLTAQTDSRRLQNRMAFGTVAEEEVIVGDKIVGRGMIGQGGSGPRITAADPKLRERIKKHSERALTGIYGRQPSASSAGSPSTLPDNPFAFDAEKGLFLRKISEWK